MNEVKLTAEERLQKLYQRNVEAECEILAVSVSPLGMVYIAPEAVDLIADLVIERLEAKNEKGNLDI